MQRRMDSIGSMFGLRGCDQTLNQCTTIPDFYQECHYCQIAPFTLMHKVYLCGELSTIDQVF